MKCDVAVVVVEVDILLVGDYGIGVLCTPRNISLDINSVSGSLGNCQSEVESDEGGNTTDTDDDSPSLIDSCEVVESFTNDLGLESGDGNDGHDTGGN
jgi:hypothetical protein